MNAIKQAPIEQTECIYFSAFAQFHVVAINEKTNKKTYLTAYPMPQDSCVIFKSKSTAHKDVRIQLEPAKPKSIYQSLNFDGYTWGCFEGKHHIFQRRLCNGGSYEVIRALEDDLHNGNMEYFVKNGLSR